MDDRTPQLLSLPCTIDAMESGTLAQVSEYDDSDTLLDVVHKRFHTRGQLIDQVQELEYWKKQRKITQESLQKAKKGDHLPTAKDNPDRNPQYLTKVDEWRAVLAEARTKFDSLLRMISTTIPVLHELILEEYKLAKKDLTERQLLHKRTIRDDRAYHLEQLESY